jgi:hypothetical protein
MFDDSKLMFYFQAGRCFVKLTSTTLFYGASPPHLDEDERPILNQLIAVLKWFRYALNHKQRILAFNSGLIFNIIY